MPRTLPPPQKLRECLFREAIAYLPRLLELVDRNRMHATYGCFDRAFWHYRTSDFPSGMYQEAVLPLALAYLTEHPANRFYGQERIRELAVAGIHYAATSSHRQGSCDDYFPYERAAGAAGFSLYACTEAYQLLGLEDPFLVEFFKRRALYLAKEGFRESGVLSNHKALIVLCLYQVFQITQDVIFKEYAHKCLTKLLELQTGEGWFPEYGGCDPGYLSFTIDFLAKYYQKSGDSNLVEPLVRAIEFASYFLHPDGTYGGEYGSRNTYHLLPHGLEIMGKHSPWALWMVNRFLHALENRNRSFIDDDRIFIHYVYNYLQAYRDFRLEREDAAKEREVKEIKYFKEAGLCVVRTEEHYAVFSLCKGGVGKIYRGGELLYADSGLVGKSTGGKILITQVSEGWRIEFAEDRFEVEGTAYEYRQLLLKPWSFLLFRLFQLCLGRFLPANILRRMIQKKAILKAGRRFPLRVRKEVSFDRLDEIHWHLELTDPVAKIDALYLASDATFTYVATSQPYQPGTLMPWRDLSSYLPELNEKRTVSFTVRLS